MFHSEGGGHGARPAIWIGGVFAALWIFGIFAFFADGGYKPHGEKDANSVYQDHPQAGEKKTKELDFVDASYRSLQLFHFHDMHYSEGTYSMAARYTLGIYGLGLPILLIGFLFKGHIRRWWHQLNPFSEFVVVAGRGPEARMLAEDIHENRRSGPIRDRRKVVWVTSQDAPGEHVPFLCIRGEVTKSAFWKNEVAIRRAGEVVILGMDDSENIGISLAIEDALKGREGQPMPCHLHLLDLRLRRGLDRHGDALSGVSPITRLYFSKYEIIARLFARQHAPKIVVSDPAEPREHFILVGFGQFGQHMALRLEKLGLQIVASDEGFETRNLMLTVVDRAGESVLNNFLHSHDSLRGNLDLEFTKVDCADEQFLKLEFLREKTGPERRTLIFCLENEALVVGTLLSLMDHCRHDSNAISEVFLRCAKKEGVAQLLGAGKLSLPVNVETFAPDNEIFTADIVLRHSLDFLAEKVHNFYRETMGADPSSEPIKPWGQLSEDHRESSREAADHMWAKVLGLNYTLRIADGSPPAPQSANWKLIDEVKSNWEPLLRAEHNRWMAWILQTGWRYGAKKDPAKKTHPCIVQFDELPDCEKCKDDAILRVLTSGLEQGWLVADPVPPVGPVGSLRR